jgi:hypothetical protein
MLGSLVDTGLSSHTLLLNLCTMYELCGGWNRSLKVELELADRVAGRV